jgi:UDP-glucose 4-epimerase
LLAEEGHVVTGLVRASANLSHLRTVSNLAVLTVDDYDNTASYKQCLRSTDVVVHLAARVHVLNDSAIDPLAAFRRVNVLNTKMLATAAAKAGVKRYIYVSSIKVNGESTNVRSFEADDSPGFSDSYGQSKWEAEEVLREIAGSSEMEWSIVRPPLIYGPNVRGNFLSLMHVVKKKLPIPLGAVNNRRSLVSVFNFADLLKTMIDHPRAAGQIFLVKDSDDISTPDLIRQIAGGMKCHARLVSVPQNCLLIMGRLFRREELMTRLCSNLVVSAEKTKVELGWVPPMSLTAGIGLTCKWFNNAASEATL